MRRISASNLRFVSVVYVYVHFHRKSRVLLELLAFEPFYFAGSSWAVQRARISASNLCFFSVVYVYVHFRRKSRVSLSCSYLNRFHSVGVSSAIKK